MAVLVVLPGEEFAEEGEGVVEGREAVGEVGAVLEVLELGFGMWVVCALQRHTRYRVKVPAGQLSLRPEAPGAAQEATNGLKHYRKRPRKEASEACGP